jgi:uncharacterized protein (DUF885 family)
MLADSERMAAGIDDLLAAFFDRELEDSPVAASALGIDGYDDRLGEYDAAAFERRAAADRQWRDRFAALADDDLDDVHRLDRDLVLSTLRGRVAMEDWAVWRRNPDTYLNPGLSGVFTLFLHRLHPEGELAASAAARLRQVPAILDAGRANLDPSLVSPVFAERAKGQCAAAVTYSRDLLPAEVAHDDDARRALAEAGAIAADAYERFGAFLDELVSTASGAFAVGEDRYTTLLQQRELLDLDTSALTARGHEQYDELAAEMSELTERIDGSRDWRALVGRLNLDHPPTPDDMRATYETWTARARAFLVEHDLVTLPDGEECLVTPSPHFQRPILAVASYSLPPPFRPTRTGHFFVPYPPDGTPDDAVQRRLESNNFSEIPTVSVHEAYPGHHWHLVCAKESGRPVRSLLRSAFFAEGWALYAERMMRSQGFFTDPRHELMHLKDRLFRAARIVVDTGLHTGELTFEDAVAFMMGRAGLPEPTARAEVGRYCSWPTQASSYLTGSLEIERMQRAWPGSLKDFHDRIARLGCMPVALHERGLGL